MRSLAVVLISVVLAGCGSRSGDGSTEDKGPIPVRVRQPNRVERPSYVSASGTVEAAVAVHAAFQLAGKVARVYVDEGQAVKQGQLLATLDATDYRHALDAASAQAQAAQATEQKAQAGPRKEELEQARIDFEHWDDEYRRMRFLYERKSLPANDFRKVEAAWKAARERYDMAREGTRSEDRQAASAGFRAATAQASVARKRLDDTRLLAPISGFIGMRRIEPGDTVGAGMPVFSVLDLDPVKVRAGIPEAEIGKVRTGAPAVVIIPALDNASFAGRVELAGVAADPASRTYSVKISVPNPNHVLRAGMVAEVRIEGAGKVNAVTIPGSAVVRDPQGATFVYVYYPERTRVYARRVEMGAPLGSELEVRSGLSGNEAVVVAGQQAVREGSLVEVAR